jgi:PBP1b-binding outer membrane lipoprotein LpoB
MRTVVVASLLLLGCSPTGDQPYNAVNQSISNGTDASSKKDVAALAEADAALNAAGVAPEARYRGGKFLR